ncbi:MAG TPA: methionine synthase [Streptosporangiaceae bacterium]|nr:methionine synthase [Streptosporangiaceae bacterium]
MERSGQFPWQAGSATGVGSMPGTDVAQACRVVFGELPDLPFLPELPDRGPGAEITGRTAALLVDMPVQTTARGWKLADRPGRDASRAAGFWSQDLDTLEEVADGYAGPVKVQACGPVTLAATLELTRSLDPALSDPGAFADLTASLAEGLAAHVADVRKRVPAAAVIVQLDEPALPAALAGRVPTASGLNFVRAVEPVTATQYLGAVLSAAAGAASTTVHCCAAGSPFRLMADAGAEGIGFDLGLVRNADVDLVAELAEAGLALMAGALPTSSVQRLVSGPPLPARQTAEAVVGLWRKTGLAPDRMAAQVVITPACGLAGVSPAAARAALEHCREAGRIAVEMIEAGN